MNTVQWHGRNQILQKKPLVIFDVAHNSEGLQSFIDYYKTLKILGESTLILALYIRKRIQDIVPQLENIFEHIICTETGGRNPMPVDILRGNFSSGKSIEIEKDSKTAIRKGLKRLSEDSGMAILGTHCLGPAVNEQFKISFDSL